MKTYNVELTQLECAILANSLGIFLAVNDLGCAIEDEMDPDSDVETRGLFLAEQVYQLLRRHRQVTRGLLEAKVSVEQIQAIGFSLLRTCGIES